MLFFFSPLYVRCYIPKGFDSERNPPLPPFCTTLTLIVSLLFLLFPLSHRRLSANVTEAAPDRETAVFTIPENGLKLDKEYKITYKFRVGRGVSSGLIKFPLAFDGPAMELDVDELLVRVR